MLKEARATMQVGKLLGMNCMGKEEEIINRIVEMEVKDQGQVGDGGRKDLV